MPSMQIAQLFVLGLVSLPGIQQDSRRLDVRTILERTARVYAECRTYRDSGVVKTLFIRGRGNRTVKKPFTTAFVRSDRFRYEFLDRRGVEEFDRYLVWRQGEVVRTWWDIQPGVEEPATLDQALSAARGVSGASSYTIPDLLLDLSAGFARVTDLGSAERKADDVLDGAHCFVVQGGTLDEPMTLWIDQGTFLLRRIDERHTFADFRIEETTTYEPQLDGQVPEELLAFDPPDPAQEAPGFAPPPARQCWDEPGAREILKRMAEVYAECTTYQDRGVVESVILDEGRGKRTERVPFTTAFVRPDRFRYECKARRGEEEFDRCLAWRQGEDVRSWWDVTQETDVDALPAAMSSAWGVTNGSATTIPGLLLPEEWPVVLLRALLDVERMEDDVLDGLPCFVIHGTWAGRSMTSWVDQTSHLLRRTLTQDGFRTQTTTTYQPVLDGEIPDSLLVFDPPVPEER